MSIKIPRHLIVILILTGIAIGSTAYYSYRNIVLTSQSALTISNSKESLFLIEQVLSQVSNVEESAGKTILTGEKKYSDEYYLNLKMLALKVASLKDFEKMNSPEGKNLLNIESEIFSVSAIVDTALQIRLFSGGNTREYIENERAKAGFDAIKAVLNQMAENENNLLLLSEDKNSKATTKSVYAILFSAGLALLFIIWLLVRLNADILKREKAEKSAGENEKKYQNIFEHIGDVVYTADYKGYFKFINPRVYDITGYTPQELMWKHFSFIVPPEWLEDVSKHYLAQLRNRTPETLKEFQILTKTGEKKWIEQKAVISQEGDRVIDFQCTVRDITVRKKMEDALVQSNKKFQNIFNSSPFAISITELETGEFRDINNEFTTVFGFTKEDVKGRSTVNLGMLTQAERNQIIQDVMVYGAAKNKELLFHTKSGSVITCLYSNILIDVDGTPCLLVLYSNITELKRLETALAESNKKFLTIFSSSLQAVCLSEITTYENPGAITEVNKAFCELFEVKKSEVIGFTMPELGLISPEKLTKVLTDFSAKKFAVNQELNMFRKSGEKITCLISFNEIALSGAFYRVWIFNNITDRKKLENELVAAKERAEESTRSKELFFANMSHEIRTPITGIIGLAGLLSETSLTDEQNEYLSGIAISSESLLSLINEILDISKINAGKMVLEKIPFNLHAIIKNIVLTMEPRATQKGLQFNYKIDRSVPEVVVGDSIRLSQILWNIAGNAIKFTDKGFVEISVVKLSEESGKMRLLFTITDTGIGIPKNRIAGIFEEFMQADSSTSRKYGGTGLGLAIANKLVELHGGTVSIESQEGVGSAFRFSLEYGKYTAQFNLPGGMMVSDKVLSENRVDLTGLSVLLAEDNKINQKVCKKILTGKGAKMDIVDNGKEAIEALEAKSYDIILMDIQMPEINGYEAAQFIRTKMNPPKSNIPIIALTAFAMEGESDKCFKMGMNGYISKPFKAPELCAKIWQLTQKEKPIVAN